MGETAAGATLLPGGAMMGISSDLAPRRMWAGVFGEGSGCLNGLLIALFWAALVALVFLLREVAP